MNDSIIMPLVIIFSVFCVSGAFYLAFKTIRWMRVYKVPYAYIQSDPMIVERLGSPIQEGWWNFWTIRNGRAYIYFPIYGPKTSAKVYIYASKVEYKWFYVEIQIKFKGDSKWISLDNKDIQDVS